jgi:rfaE bifunctional protein kinase chain/domain
MHKVLVVGDLMLDHYTFVSSSRQAAEAPIPIWDQEGGEWRLGGAANVAHNLKSLGKEDIEVWAAGICAKNHELRAARDWISRAGINVGLVGGSQTMVKHRFVHNNQVIFRVDNIKHFDDLSISTYEAFFKNFAIGRMFDFDAVVFSDYNKGTVTREMVEAARLAAKPGTIFVVDSKRHDLSMFKDFDVCKLNEHEYSAQIAHPKYTNPERLFKYVFVTKGSKGAELRMGDPVATRANRYVVHTENFPTDSVDPVDVTGCGDTALAGLTFSLLLDPGDVRKAVRFANLCATKVVQKFGTATVQ